MRNRAEDFQEVQCTCTSCHKPFVWEAGEQAFMQDLYEEGKIELVIPPKRCKACRLARKQSRERQ